jgi:hypothetical protein
MWQLPGNIWLELNLSREGQVPLSESDPIGIGRWNQVLCQIACAGTPSVVDGCAVFRNDADNLWDDLQFRTNLASNGMCYEFSFTGRYSPATDEWNGTFRAMVPPAAAPSVPEGGGTLTLLCGALSGLCALRRRSMRSLNAASTQTQDFKTQDGELIQTT